MIRNKKIIVYNILRVVFIFVKNISNKFPLRKFLNILNVVLFYRLLVFKSFR